MWLVIDGERIDLAGGYGPVDAELARIKDAMFRCEVEQLHLADGGIRLMNWRMIRTVLAGED
jgi:hypothetical protein